jgi:hypothetical protein
MSKETSNAKEGPQGMGRNSAHPDAGVGGNPSGLSTPIAAGGGSNMYDQREAELQATIQRLEAEAEQREREFASDTAIYNMRANDTITALQAERDRLRSAIQKVIDGDFGREHAKIYRDDGTLSKHDWCPHDLHMWEDCGPCIDEFLAAALAGKD